MGGKVDRMHKTMAAYFIGPPSSMLKSIIVNKEGKRFIDEARFVENIFFANMHEGMEEIFAILSQSSTITLGVLSMTIRYEEVHSRS